jgi:hypothetical protein
VLPCRTRQHHRRPHRSPGHVESMLIPFPPAPPRPQLQSTLCAQVKRITNPFPGVPVDEPAARNASQIYFYRIGILRGVAEEDSSALRAAAVSVTQPPFRRSCVVMRSENGLGGQSQAMEQCWLSALSCGLVDWTPHRPARHLDAAIGADPGPVQLSP